MFLQFLSVSVFAVRCSAGSARFTVPQTAPQGSARLDAAPISFSIEFPELVNYLVNISNTYNCLGELQKLTGVWPAIRTGGTTEDRSFFDPALQVPVVQVNQSYYYYGPEYLKIASEHPGKITLGLNRGANNITNTVDAAQAAQSLMTNLYAIELGNEPVIFPYLGFPIAPSPDSWTPIDEAASESEWQITVGSALDETPIIQAANYYTPPEYGFTAEALFANEDPAALKYVKVFSHHNYPQTVANTTSVPQPDLPQLMNHSMVVANVEQYASDVQAANRLGFEWIFGETNSVSGEGSPVISKTFGAALWVLDYALRAASTGIPRLHFHQGSYETSLYVWWTPFGVTSPMYGGYVATAAMAGGAHISALDNGESTYGGYVVYSSSGRASRIVLINSDYYDGSGVRTATTFALDGLDWDSATVTRLTASSAMSRQDYGDMPSFGGRAISNTTCALQGPETKEKISVSNGTAQIELAASEAVLIEL